MLLRRDDLLWPKPVVYGLFHQGSLVWVGQSQNLPNRIWSHMKDGRVFDEVWFQPVAQRDLDRIEKALIKSCRPSENRRDI